MTNKNHNKNKMFLVFAVAIFVRLLNPTTLTLDTGLYEAIAAITLLMICLYVNKKNIFQKQNYPWGERLGFITYSVFATLSYIYGRELSLHDWNAIMCIYGILSIAVNYYLAQYGYELIRYFLTNNQSSSIKNKFLAKQIASNNFAFYFVCLLVPYFIYLIVNYPAVLMYDPLIQILQIKGLPNLVTSQVNLIDPNQFITAHHPVLHTMMIKLFLSIGEMLGAAEIGLFLFGLFQIVIVALTIAYLLTYVHKYFSDRAMLAWLLIFSLNPIVLMYTGLLTKDTLFAVLFAMFAVKFYEYIKDNTVLQNKKWTTYFLIITILCSLFRNNFFYAVAITFVSLLICKRDKRLLKAFAVYLCIYCTFTYVLVPGMGITSGSIREVISVPFQQTANYAKHYELTEEERAVISRVLDCDIIVEKYDPEVSNNVKNTYNKYATTEDLMNYFKTWATMFLKHPLAYIDAYLNQFYGYFSAKPYYAASYYLDPNRVMWQSLNEFGVVSMETLPFLSAKQLFSSAIIVLSSLPGLYLINNSGIYIWILLAAIIVLKKNNQQNRIWFYAPFLLYFATCLISPANASVEYRYLFPYLIAMPILVVPAREAICATKNLRTSPETRRRTNP